MIARTWTARATADGAVEYLDKVRAEELPHFRSVPGYRGCRFMTRETSGGGGRVVRRIQIAKCVEAMQSSNLRVRTGGIDDEFPELNREVGKRLRLCLGRFAAQAAGFRGDQTGMRCSPSACTAC